MSQEKRIFGLDLLRATAVLFVIFHHSLDFVSPTHLMQAFGRLGSLGVEFLLILTGYLVGHSLLKKFRQDKLNAGQIGNFYFRRWSRTLPPYYFFLLIMATVSPIFILQVWSHLEYFLFLQNLAWTCPAFYRQTWTLAVQEFFYVISPLLLVTGGLLFRNRRLAFLVPVAAFMLVPLIVRMLHTHVEDAKGFNEIFRQIVIFRLDSPAIGLLVAFIEVEFPGIWSWVLNRAWLGALCFGAIATYYLMNFPGLYSSHWGQVFFFPLISLCVASLFPFLCNWKENSSWFARGIRSISDMTYTIYVSHYLAFHFGVLVTGLYAINSLPLVYAIYIFLIWAIAYPCYLLVEAPLMRLRNGEGAQQGSLVPVFQRGFVKAQEFWEFLQQQQAWKKLGRSMGLF